MQTKKNIKSAQQYKKTKGVFRFADFLIVVFFLFLASSGIILFRQDLLQTFGKQNKEPAGIVIIKKNVVQRRLGDRVLWDRLVNESPVYPGDLIRIADISSASLDIENNSIDLDENTLIRIAKAPGGEGFHIQLSSGKLSVSSGGAAKGISLELNGQQIKTGPGTVLSAAAGEKRTTIQVNGGTAKISKNGNNSGALAREVSSGQKLAMDLNGNEIVEKSAAVMRPVQNARYLKSSGEPVTVGFEWNRFNLSSDEKLRLDIAMDKNFNKIFRVINGLDRQAQVSFDTGLWYWRLSSGNTVLSDGRITVVESSGLQLISPALNSLFRYRNEPPALNFRWSREEDAVSYIIEVSKTPDFSSAQIRAQVASVNYSNSSMGDGTWYWRVMPVFPAVFSGSSSFSKPSFFRIERDSAEQTALERNNLEEYISIVTPSKENLPPDLPPEFVYSELKQEPKLETRAEPLRPKPRPPVPLLPAPVNVRPAAGKRYGLEELKPLKNIVFEWKTVKGANAYIFTLYQRTEKGRRQLAVTGPAAKTSYVLENLKVLENGTFIWQVEAVSMKRNGVIERRGRIGEYSFVLNYPLPEPVQIEDAGILYGN